MTYIIPLKQPDVDKMRTFLKSFLVYLSCS